MIVHPHTGQILFARWELASRDGTVRTAPGFQQELLQTRMAFGRPMTLNSACRDPLHNAAVGGADNSFHLTEGNPLCPGGTCAVDVAVPDNAYRHHLASLAYSRGWSVGHYESFLHIDRRADYGHPPVSWWS